MSRAAAPSASVGVIGFGEVGSIFASAFAAKAADLHGPRTLPLASKGEREAAPVSAVRAWDRTFADPVAGPPMQGRAREAGIVACGSMAELLERCDWVFSAVTAEQTLAVAREASASLRPGTTIVDLNSASPRTKTACAALVEAAGGRYVEAAVMTSVPPHGLRVPMLLGGPHAAGAEPILRGWGLDATAASAEWGVASAIKMCRSVIVKGMEALVIESFTAARAYGVEAQVIASLDETFPAIDWNRQADYFYERVIRHGVRRAEEMVESAATMADAGLGGTMAAAASARQAWVADLAREGAFEGGAATGWRGRADAALGSLARAAATKGAAR